MEEGRERQTERARERETERNAEEEICGEIIIPGVTVATFYEVDVNKMELHSPFQFHLKGDAAEGRLAAGRRSAAHVGKRPRFRPTHGEAAAGDVRRLQTGWEAHRCLESFNLSKQQGSVSPRIWI